MHNKVGRTFLAENGLFVVGSIGRAVLGVNKINRLVGLQR
jgi:hypothetical protein